MRSLHKSVLKLAIWAVPFMLAASTVAAETDVSEKRQGELLYILEQDCGSCHGLTMRGGLGPPLTRERMDEWSVSDLVEVIMEGVPGTPMPPWRPLLDEAEVLFIAKVLKSGEMVK